MRGNIIGFDPDTNTGAISGHDGARYDFVTQDWHGRSPPRHGDIVDFQTQGGRAFDIYVIEAQYASPGFWQFYFSPTGRISRSQYWLRFFLPLFIIGLILNVLKFAGEPFKALPVLFQFVVLWPGIAVLIKRIHDRNKSGWLVWAAYGPLIVALIFGIAALAAIGLSDKAAGAVLGVIAGVFGIAAFIVGIWFFIEFGCMRGSIGANRFGPDPVPIRERG
jgi:uncharacterized membrane protein YhaH (DUF805 family)